MNFVLPLVFCSEFLQASMVAKILGFDIQKGVKKSYREYFVALNKNKKEWFFKKNSRKRGI